MGDNTANTKEVLALVQLEDDVREMLRMSTMADGRHFLIDFDGYHSVRAKVVRDLSTLDGIRRGIAAARKPETMSLFEGRDPAATPGSWN